jgi:hypothetical protein
MQRFSTAQARSHGRTSRSVTNVLTSFSSVACESEVVMGRGILVFLVVLLLGGGMFWALVAGCVAA